MKYAYWKIIQLQLTYQWTPLCIPFCQKMYSSLTEFIIIGVANALGSSSGACVPTCGGGDGQESVWGIGLGVLRNIQALLNHYNDVTMSAISSQITGVSIVCPTLVSGTNQSKYQSSASLAFVRGIHRSPVNSPHKRPVTRKMFPFDDVIMHIWTGGTKTQLPVLVIVFNRCPFSPLGKTAALTNTAYDWLDGTIGHSSHSRHNFFRKAKTWELNNIFITTGRI